MSYFLTQACINLRPEAGVSIDESGIHWYNISENDIPSNEEIEAESNRLQNIYNSKEYQRQRAAEYPSFADQFDLLYHGGYDAWKNVITAVKTKYPKPE
jgi:hypothetical protein